MSRVGLYLPVHYGAALQGFIYSQLEPNLARWLHGEAYRAAKRTYRMFCFSRLTPANGSRYHVGEGRIRFDGPASFVLASHNTELLCSLAEHLLKAPQVQLGANTCEVRGVEVLKKPAFDPSRPVRVRALAPITVYSTLSHADGRKKTYYYTPFESDWHDQLRNNLARKAEALGWEEDAGEVLKGASFKPFRVRPQDQKIITYRGTVIKGWLGHYELSGVPEGYMELFYDTGLGAKNAQGFGMVEVVR